VAIIELEAMGSNSSNNLNSSLKKIRLSKNCPHMASITLHSKRQSRPSLKKSISLTSTLLFELTNCKSKRRNRARKNTGEILICRGNSSKESKNNVRNRRR
jgi:hypothetical protein